MITYSGVSWPHQISKRGALLALVLGCACQEATEPTTPARDEQSNPSPRAAVVVAQPTISAISGVSNLSVLGIYNGLVAMDCGKTWNGYRVVNDRTGTYPWKLSGQNFGSAVGTVTLGGQVVRITAWQPTSITIDPTLPWYSGRLLTTLRVRTATGLVVSQGVSVVPAISSRIYGQCTHFVAYRRKQMGLQPSPTAFGGYSAITASYVPKRGDQYQWN